MAYVESVIQQNIEMIHVKKAFQFLRHIMVLINVSYEFHYSDCCEFLILRLLSTPYPILSYLI